MQESNFDYDSLFDQALFPNSSQRRKDFLENEGLLVHYTTAETVQNILSPDNPSLWMRSANVMNDWSEISHGYDQLGKALQSDVGLQFQQTLDEVWPDSIKNTLEYLNSYKAYIANHTYIFSVSEHLPEEKDHGRLSMWRAYGGTHGVAIVLNTTAFKQDKSRLGLVAHPAIYGDHAEIVSDFQITNQLFRENLVHLRNRYQPDQWKMFLARFFLTYMICVKHPAFAEEKEWRVISTIAFNTAEPPISPIIRVIGGLPQQIVPIPLRDDSAQGFIGYEPNSLINHLLIGPTEYPIPLYKSMVEILRNAKVEHPETRVQITGIPLRPNQR